MLDPAAETRRSALFEPDAAPQLDLFLDDARRRPGFLEVHLSNMQEPLLDRCAPGRSPTQQARPAARLRVSDHYAWDWPRVPPHGAGFNPERESRPAETHGLLEDIFGEIAEALSAPCPVFREGDMLRVELLDAIAWVVDRGRRSLYLEFRDLDGAWVKARRPVNIADPLGDPFWIDQVTLRWARAIEHSFAERAAVALWSLQSALAQRFHRRDTLAATSRQVRHHLDVVPGVSRAIREIRRWSPETGFDGDLYAEIWRSEAAWMNLANHYPNLLHLYYVAWREGVIEPGAGLAAFRATCFGMGLGRAGWRFLSRHGANAYEAVWRTGDDETTPLAELLAYVDWQARGNLRTPLAPTLGVCLKWTACFRRDRDGNCSVVPDPRLGRIAVDAWAGCENDGAAVENLLTRWLEVVEWIRDHAPAFDRNQWKAGWPAIERRYQRWRRRRTPVVHWARSLEPFTMDGFRVCELTCSTELVDEGMTMHHCVANYIDECVDGRCRIFSVMEASTGRPVATMGFWRGEDCWDIDEVRGRCNRDPEGPVLRLAGQVLARLNGTLSSTPAGS